MRRQQFTFQAIAKYAASYAVKAATDANMEREWQLEYLPENLKSIVDSKE